MFLRDVPHIRQSLDDLRGSDSIFSTYNITDDMLPWPILDKGFKGFVRIVQGQQISATVANSLWHKLTIYCEESGLQLTPQSIRSADIDTLRPLGFSAQKFSYITAMAEAIENGDIDLIALEEQDNEAIINEITKIKGFGPWSAQLYLMFSLTRPNVLPAKDLGLDRAVQKVFKLNERPPYTQVKQLTKRWDGTLTAATLLLWAIYGNDL